jgi:hypothetical protein
MRLGCLELACRENRSMRGVFHLESLGFVFGEAGWRFARLVPICLFGWPLGYRDQRFKIGGDFCQPTCALLVRAPGLLIFWAAGLRIML